MIRTWKAMGTTVEIHASTQRDATGAEAMISDAERRFSRFLPDSELSMLNGAGPGRHEISPEMHDVLTIAAELRDRTGGMVDPGIGAALIDFGYASSFETVTDLPKAATTDRRLGRWSLDDDSVILEGDLRLDLGGIVKGWTCDRVVEAGLASVASAGGDLRSVDEDLRVEVLDPQGDAVVTVHVGIGGFATSSRTKRRWKFGSMEAHHLIDPRSMAPAVTPILSASVATRTAVEAEAGAKAVLLRGADGLAWADREDWIDFALAIWQDGSVYGTQVRRAS